jgi:hypothetical protein
MATRFRKARTRKMRKSRALKTRKHRGGDGILERLGLKKKSPLSTTGPTPSANNMANNVQMMNLASIGVKHSDLLKVEKTTQIAKKIRNHATKYENASQNVKQSVMNILNKEGRREEKQKLLQIVDYPGWKSLSDKQLLELYLFGKPRSSSA